MTSQKVENAGPLGRLVPIVGYLVVAVVALAGGWYAARQTSSGPGAADPSTHAPHGPPEFEPETLKNLGVELGEIRPTQHTVHRSLRAHIEPTPFTSQPIQAPLGGRVESISVSLGEVVAPGHVLVTIMRDPIPRPALTMTGGILRPSGESIHEAVNELREASQELEIATAELERLREFGGDVVPASRIIALEYDVRRAQSRRSRATHELEKHGFSEAQIGPMAEGGAIPALAAEAWRRALQKNGLWPASAERLHEVLPDKDRDRLWSVASIGELSARGLDTPELMAWLAEEPGAAAHFSEIASLLQRGHSVPDLQRLSALGALDPVIQVKAPTREGTPDWDVHEILVKAGARVEIGTELLSLHDPRRLYLVTDPVGGEETDILPVVARGATVRARPLVPGAGPELTDLRIEYFGEGSHPGTAHAFLSVPNEVLVENPSEAGPVRRSWRLRPGMPYRMEIPVRTFENVFVLPVEAIADDGPRKVVYVPSKGSFRGIPVAIAHMDHELAVIPAGPGCLLNPGDRVVLRGAFALGLALSGDAGSSGHGHSH